jgi:hypothetical protein
MATALDDYFSALERLKANKPIRIPKGSKITNDAVSLEAGRGKGSIKKSRPIFADIIAAIDAAADEQARPRHDEKAKIHKAKDEAAKYRQLYEEAIAREISLVKENHELRKQLAQLGGKKVVRLK